MLKIHYQIEVKRYTEFQLQCNTGAHKQTTKNKPVILITFKCILSFALKNIQIFSKLIHGTINKLTVKVEIIRDNGKALTNI
jgi:hypothetical protein